MDWDRIRRQWQSEVPAAPSFSIAELQAQAQKLQKRVRRRDLLETVAAVVVAVFFGFRVLGEAADGNRAAAAFALLIVAWAVFVPVRLRHARRQSPGTGHALALVDHLGRQRDAALAQARMLESVWLWYLAPPLVGLVGLTLAIDGLSTFTFVYLPIVALLCLGIGWLNRRVARTKFRAHAGQLQRQIDALNGEDGP